MSLEHGERWWHLYCQSKYDLSFRGPWHADSVDKGLLWGENHSGNQKQLLLTKWNPAMYGHEPLVHGPWSWLRPNKQADNREWVVGQVGPNRFHLLIWLISPRKVRYASVDIIKEGHMQFYQFSLFFRGDKAVTSGSLDAEYIVLWNKDMKQ